MHACVWKANVFLAHLEPFSSRWSIVKHEFQGQAALALTDMLESSLQRKDKVWDSGPSTSYLGLICNTSM